MPLHYPHCYIPELLLSLHQIFLAWRKPDGRINCGTFALYIQSQSRRFNTCTNLTFCSVSGSDSWCETDKGRQLHYCINSKHFKINNAMVYEPGITMPHSQGFLCGINPIPRIDTCFFKIHSNIVFNSRLGLFKGLLPGTLPIKILKILLPYSILAICPAHLDLSSWLN